MAVEPQVEPELDRSPIAVDDEREVAETVGTRRPGLSVAAGRRVLGELARPLALFVASRLVTLSAIGIAVVVKGVVFSDVIHIWDGGWWMSTTLHGYPHAVPMVDGHAGESTIAFFPLFPLLARGVMNVTGLPLLGSLLVVTTVFGGLTAVGLWYLTRRILDADTADRTVALFCFFPGSFIFSLVYAEPVMLALAVGCLLFLLQRRWLLAGVLAAMATASRPNAAVLIVCCAWEAGFAVMRRREWRALIAPALAPVGIVSFFVFLRVRTGSLRAWFDVEKGGWNERIEPTALWHYIQTFARNGFAEWNIPVPLAGAVLILIGAVLLVRARVPPVLLVYTAGIVILTLSSKTLGARPRFVLTAFPLFIGLAAHVRRLGFTVVVAVFAALLTLITVLSTATLALTP